MSLEFLAYADIHHDEYKNGITLEDTISIEDQITEYAKANNIKHVIFAGDWFRATNPIQSVIKSAEASWKRRSDAGIMTTAIPGNHDWWTKLSLGGHAFAAVGIFNYDLKNIEIVDRVEVRKIGDVNFMFIPAGHSLDIAPIPVQPLIVVFHGMVAGSALENGGTARGIDPADLKKLGAMMYLGGDNHTPQVLPSLGVGRYLGAPLQHTWGARGQTRGFWHIGVCEDQVFSKLVPVIAPKFLRTKIQATTEMETALRIHEAMSMELGSCPGIVDITLIGKEAGNIDIEFITNTIKSHKPRSVVVSVDRAFERVEITPNMQQLETSEDKWCAYVASGNAPSTDGLQPTVLAEMGKWAIQEARKTL